MKKTLINARYFLAPLLILAALFGVIAGGPWVWTGVLLLGVGIIVDTLTTAQTPGAGFDDEGDTNGIVPLLNGTMYGMLAVFALIQIALAWRIWQYMNGVPIGVTEIFGMSVQDGITGRQLIGAVMSSGIFAGIGIIYGHELAHTKGFSFVIARWMMALSGKAHFCYAHVYNHHLELAQHVRPLPTVRLWTKQIPLHDGKATPRKNWRQLPILAKPLDSRLLHGPTDRITLLVRRRLDWHALSSRRMADLQLRA